MNTLDLILSLSQVSTKQTKAKTEKITFIVKDLQIFYKNQFQTTTTAQTCSSLYNLFLLNIHFKQNIL